MTGPTDENRQRLNVVDFKYNHWNSQPHAVYVSRRSWNVWSKGRTRRGGTTCWLLFLAVSGLFWRGRSLLQYATASVHLSPQLPYWLLFLARGYSWSTSLCHILPGATLLCLVFRMPLTISIVVEAKRINKKKKRGKWIYSPPRGGERLDWTDKSPFEGIGGVVRPIPAIRTHLERRDDSAPTSIHTGSLLRKASSKEPAFFPSTI